MDSAETILSVENLTIERDKCILDGIDWTVKKGEKWVILGSNGSGKTSLLKSLAGYFTPTSGTIRVLKKTYGRYNWNNLRLKIGLVSNFFQQKIEDTEPAVDLVVSGKYAQVNYWGRIFKRDRQKAIDLMAQLNCEYLHNKTWLTCSQGEKQLLLIARALMTNLEMLILDEPCAGLDPIAREQFLNSVDSLAKNKPEIPIILVTHHVEEITPSFSHVLILKNGSVVSSGPFKSALSSKNLSEAFSAPLRLRRTGGRFQLTMQK